MASHDQMFTRYFTKDDTEVILKLKRTKAGTSVGAFSPNGGQKAKAMPPFTAVWLQVSTITQFKC